jgi:hypothetical protein
VSHTGTRERAGRRQKGNSGETPASLAETRSATVLLRRRRAPGRVLPCLHFHPPCLSGSLGRPSAARGRPARTSPSRSTTRNRCGELGLSERPSGWHENGLSVTAIAAFLLAIPDFCGPRCSAPHGALWGTTITGQATSAQQSPNRIGDRGPPRGYTENVACPISDEPASAVNPTCTM